MRTLSLFLHHLHNFYLTYELGSDDHSPACCPCDLAPTQLNKKKGLASQLYKLLPRLKTHSFERSAKAGKHGKLCSACSPRFQVPWRPGLENTGLSISKDLNCEPTLSVVPLTGQNAHGDATDNNKSLKRAWKARGICMQRNCNILWIIQFRQTTRYLAFFLDVQTCLLMWFGLSVNAKLLTWAEDGPANGNYNFKVHGVVAAAD